MDGPLSLDTLVDLTWEALGQNTALYPRAEVIDSGLSPAQRLLALLHPTALTTRIAVSLVAQQAFLDLRDLLPASLIVQRLVHGLVLTDDVQRSLGTVEVLRPTTRQSLAWKDRSWWRQTGRPTQWYRDGIHRLGLYRRVQTPCTITVIARRCPAAFTVEPGDQVSPLPMALHPLLPSLAAALLLVKEGQIESQRAIQHLGTALGDAHVEPMQKALGRLVRAQAMQATLNAQPQPQEQGVPA